MSLSLLCAACLWSGYALGADAVYGVQAGDILTVSAWKETDLQADVLVRPDGSISFPLAGDLVVAGLGPAQIAEAISTRLKRYIPDPLITVLVKSIGGNHIYVVGKVNRPGEYAFNRPLDVMQALSLAAGTTAFADLSGIRILRREGDKQVAIRFDYGDVERGRDLEQNIQLRSGDTVVVP